MKENIITNWQDDPIHLKGEHVILVRSDYQELLTLVVDYHDKVVELQGEVEKLQKLLDTETAQGKKMTDAIQQLQAFLIIATDFATDVMADCGFDYLDIK